jgi:hypothetical protein
MPTTSERNHQPGMPPILTDEELSHLYVAYERALDEYSEAASAVYECTRRRSLPTAQEFARKRVAQLSLMDARRAFWKATRRTQRAH